MLQRNDTASVHVLPTLDPPREVAPGEILDYPEPLDGFTAVEQLDRDDTGAEVPAAAVVEAPWPVEPGPTSLDSGTNDGTPPAEAALDDAGHADTAHDDADQH